MFIVTKQQFFFCIKNFPTSIVVHELARRHQYEKAIDRTFVS